MKASFFSRFAAYLIDIIILSAVASIVLSFIPNTEITELTTELTTTTTNLLDKSTVSVESYIKELRELNYQIDIKNMLSDIIVVFITILYFIYYQFKNDGKTIGKKLMHIKIVKNKGKLELNDLALRSLLINGILISIVLFIVLFISNENNYYTLKLIVQMIQFIFITTTAMMVLFRKDKQGLHDIICNTSVINYEKEED